MLSVSMETVTCVEMEPKYNFTHLKSKNFSVLNEKSALDYFLKW